MKLISEEIQNAEYLVEEANGKKSYKIKGVFLQSDIKNRNREKNSKINELKKEISEKEKELKQKMSDKRKELEEKIKNL